MFLIKKHWIQKKYTKGISILFVCFFLCSCTEIYFESAQPLTKKDETKFPKKFRGTWRIDGSGWITIKKKTVELFDKKNQVISKHNLESSGYEINGNEVRKLKDTTKSYKYVIEHDSVYFTSNSLQIISLSDSLVLRKTKENYFLSTCESKDNGWWQTYLIGATKDGGLYLIYPNESKFNESNDSSDKMKGLEITTKKVGKRRKFYCKGTLTSTIIDQLVREDVFSDTVVFLKSEYRVDN